MNQPTPKSLVLFGATGRTGQCILPLLLEKGYRVRAYVRSPEKLTEDHKNLEVVTGSLTDETKVIKAIGGADAVISTVGHKLGDKSYHGGMLLPFIKAVHKGMRKHGVKRILVQAGALSVTKNERFSFAKHILLRQVLGRVMGDHGVHVDNDQVIHYFETAADDLDWIITRPPGLVDVPNETRPVGALKKLPMPPKLSFQGLARYTVATIENSDAFKTVDYCGYEG